MKISITSYTDTEITNFTSNISSASSVYTMPEADFNSQLAAAKRAITSLSVDTVLSENKEAALNAAAVLSKSSRADLQAIGNVMSDYASSSDSTTASDAATAILQAAGYAPVSNSTTATNNASANSNGTDTTVATNSSSTSSTVSSTVSSTETATDTAAPTTETSSSNLVSSTSKNLTCSEELESYFKEAAETYNVDINLLKAIAKTESSFNPSATSSAGAMGVMQLMPFVAEELVIEDAYDAHDNIMGGASVIASHLEKYDGNLSLALAAYNAGSGAVDRAGGVPSYASKYVSKVLGFYEA